MRTEVKRQLARLGSSRPAAGTTVLIYHRVGGGTPEELDVGVERFTAQLDVLADHEVISLDEAADRAAAGDPRPAVALTFDDGFSEVHSVAWPLLRERDLPFTIYLTAGHVGAEMRWEGATSQHPGRGLTWSQIDEMVTAGRCTVGNHTWSHPRPEAIDLADVDRASTEIAHRLGSEPAHFAWPWGIPVPDLVPELGHRFRTLATGRPGRFAPGGDPLAVPRVPVRATDPLEFFVAKLGGSLLPERAYAALASMAKSLRRR